MVFPNFKFYRKKFQAHTETKIKGAILSTSMFCLQLVIMVFAKFTV